MTVTTPRAARWASARRGMPNEGRVLESLGGKRSVALGSYFPDEGTWLGYVRARGYHRFDTAEEARAYVERLAMARGWAIETPPVLTVSEALALLGEIGASYHKWTARGMAAERAAVVAWLRSEGPGSPADVWGSAVGGNEWTTAADAIERGAHREGE